MLYEATCAHCGERIGRRTPKAPWGHHSSLMLRCDPPSRGTKAEPKEETDGEGT